MVTLGGGAVLPRLAPAPHFIVRGFDGHAKLRNRRYPALGSGLAVVLSFSSALLYSAQTSFPGIAAATPVVGTLLVIASGPNGTGWPPNQFTGANPIQYVGDISYSLYLWHWPLIVLTTGILTQTLGTVDKMVVLAAAIGLAHLTKKFVEDPGRSQLLPDAKPRSVLLAMTATVVVVSAACGGLVLNLGQVQDAEEAKLQGLSGLPCYGARSLDPYSNCKERFGPPQVDVEDCHL